MPTATRKLQVLNGTIQRVAPNNIVYVVLDNGTTSGIESVAFTPSKVEGYMGEPLKAFGLHPGTRVEVSCIPSSGYVEFAQIISSNQS